MTLTQRRLSRSFCPPLGIVSASFCSRCFFASLAVAVFRSTDRRYDRSVARRYSSVQVLLHRSSAIGVRAGSDDCAARPRAWEALERTACAWAARAALAWCARTLSRKASWAHPATACASSRPRTDAARSSASISCSLAEAQRPHEADLRGSRWCCDAAKLGAELPRGISRGNLATLRLKIDRR